MNNLLTIKNKNIYISSDVLANKLNRQHRIIKNLVNNYKKELETLGVLHFENVPNKENYGKPIQVVYLNKKQYIFLITNMRTKSNELNTIMKAKLEIADKFVEMEYFILEQQTQKANQEYLETRKQSKIGRKQETDVIKEFVEYATNQGSKSAFRYYSNISTMENKAFFILKEKFKNVREILNITQLNKIIFADIIVRQALIEGMEKGMKYKDIFILAKERVLQAAATLPKEILPGIEFKQIEMGENQIEKF